MARADIPTDWNQIAITCATQPVSFLVSCQQTRELAMVHLAMHDAINSIQPRFTTYGLPITAPTKASRKAAAASAAYTMLLLLYPNLPQSKLDELETLYESHLAALPSNNRVQQGIEVGQMAAYQIYGLRQNDGAVPDPNRPPYVFATPGPGVWQQVEFFPSTLAPPADWWGEVVPFVMPSAADFRVVAPPALNSSTFINDFLEVKAFGALVNSSRTQDDTESGIWWAGNAAQWVVNGVLQQIVTDRQVGLYKSVRSYALINLALADATIANSESKYYWNFWRPITAIRAGLPGQGISPDSTWLPLKTTPPNWEYPAGHPEVSTAGVATLEHLFGTKLFKNPIGWTFNGVFRSFDRLEDVASDVIVARIAGGMHFRNSGNVGAQKGREIADLVFENALVPVDDDDVDDDD